MCRAYQELLLEMLALKEFAIPERKLLDLRLLLAFSFEIENAIPQVLLVGNSGALIEFSLLCIPTNR